MGCGFDREGVRGIRRLVVVVGAEDEGKARAVDPLLLVHPIINPTFGYTESVTWGELSRRLKAAGFVEHGAAQAVSVSSCTLSARRSSSDRCTPRRKSAPDLRSES